MTSRRVHRALVSVVATLVGSAVLMAAGWGLEMVALPRATAADKLVASAEGWLRSYPLSIDAFHNRHVRARGICRRTSTRSFARSRLAITDGPLLAVSTRRARPVRGSALPGLPDLLASRIGCTAMLLQPVVSAAVARVHVKSSHAFVANRAVIALDFPPYMGEHLVLYVSPWNGRPLAAEATLGGDELSATLHLEQVDSARIASLRPKFGFASGERR